ncbi:WD40/YVTN/BNR-like repeat-containing protein [Paenibacillus alkalitolerans]|uniref:WD40/YVTN/BNR-like repeat-containing protein n=1 Tax=Paenibacillus alkalitolerans TaxID=2799335 RepID=UPI0018F36C99|nr:hypothetical protein [Paenibacillus alkalitolerans]
MAKSKQQRSGPKFGAAAIFGIAIGLFAIAAVVSIVVNANKTEELTVNTPTHPHTFGYAPDGETMWIGTHTGMYEYGDGKWTRAVPAIAQNDVMGYFVDAEDTNIIYISGHGFVQRSTDGGETWAAIENGMPNAPKPDVPDAHMLAQDPNDPKHLYVFTNQQENNIYETKDGGETWSLAGTIEPVAYMMAVAPGGSSLLTTSEAGLTEYKLTAGNNEVIKRTDAPAYIVLTRSNGEAIVYGANGFQRSTDYNKWTPMEVDLNGELPLGIRESHTNPDRLAIVTDKYSLYESEDGGKSWSKK